MKDRLYQIVEYILNIADYDELEVISAALEKRVTEKKRSPVMGLNPAKLAAQTSDAITRDLESSKDMVKKLVSDFAADIIRKNAPELEEAQVQELLSEFMPESARGGKRSRSSAAGKGGGDKNELPAGLIIQMVQQFVDYSEGAMSPAEQVQMENEIPGWKDKYWRSFPGQVQKLLSLYLNGDIDRQRFEAHLYEVLGL